MTLCTSANALVVGYRVNACCLYHAWCVLLCSVVCSTLRVVYQADMARGVVGFSISCLRRAGMLSHPFNRLCRVYPASRLSDYAQTGVGGMQLSGGQGGCSDLLKMYL